MKKLFSVYENEKGDFQIVVKREAAPVVFGNLFGANLELPALVEAKEGKATGPKSEKKETSQPITRNRIPLRSKSVDIPKQSDADVEASIRIAKDEIRKKNMKEKQWEIVELRGEIWYAAQELANAVAGVPVSRKVVSKSFSGIYKSFAAETGYSPGKSTKLPEIGETVPTKLTTVLVEGRGRELLSFLNRQIRKALIRVI